MIKSINTTYQKTKQLASLLLVAFIMLSNLVSGQRITRQEYIKKYSELAINQMQHSGIPASIIIAQALLESDNGNSMLAVKANNHFGIKCHSNWSGETIKHTDDRKDECFRKYKKVVESYNDHSEFLARMKRYSFLFEFNTQDYKNWARGLQEAGYATNSTYAQKLIDIIEKNRLYILDNDIVPKVDIKNSYLSENKNDIALKIHTSELVIKENNRVKYIIARKNDTYESLTKKFDKMRWEIRKYNNAIENEQPQIGEIVYLEPKRNKASKEENYYILGKGETMRYVSQKFAIKLKKLYRKNRLSYGDEPEYGTKLWLRRKKPRK